MWMKFNELAYFTVLLGMKWLCICFPYLWLPTESLSWWHYSIQSFCSSTHFLRQLLWQHHCCRTSLHSLVMQKFLEHLVHLQQRFLPLVGFETLLDWIVSFYCEFLWHSWIMYSFEPGFCIERFRVSCYAYIFGGC